MSAITSLFSGIDGMKAAKKQKKALAAKERVDREAKRVTKKQNALTVQREKIAQLRDARVKRAEIINRTVNAGARVGGTSSATGATGSIISQLGQNTGQLSQYVGFGDRLSALSQQSADALSKYNRIGAKHAAFSGMMSGIGSFGDMAAGAAIGGAGGGGWMGAAKGAMSA